MARVEVGAERWSVMGAGGGDEGVGVRGGSGGEDGGK